MELSTKDLIKELRKKYSLRESTNGSVSTELIKEFIFLKGAKLEDGFKYNRAHSKFNVVCKNGHQWETFWNNIQQGRWCGYCAGLKIDEKDVRLAIENKGGILDKNWKYIGAFTRFDVTCDKNHQWETFWNNIQQGRWCPYCDGQIVDENYVRQVIKEKGGIISDSWVYKNHDTKFLIENCGNGHSFKTNWDFIQRGHWCPKCSKQFNSREIEFRNKIEKILSFDMPRKRPFRNPETNAFVELDGYNEKHKIAFEYQDYSHYKPFWKEIKKFGAVKAQEMLEKRQKRDEFKVKKAKELGICLIVMPYWIHRKEWEKEIQKQMEENFKCLIR